MDIVFLNKIVYHERKIWKKIRSISDEDERKGYKLNLS